MPFGLTNAPAVFQRLMEKVLTRLNPEDGPDFVAVYIDDIMIIDRLEAVGLKLKPVKCKFIRSEVEYLGHVVTPKGLKVNHKLTEAVQEFPRPMNVTEVRRFLGLASYYRRFVRQFAKIAEPLRALTRKGVEFEWTTGCQESMDQLKHMLVLSPVLAYPSFDKPFVLETDASVKGIGAVLSQQQEDRKQHPIAFASRSLTPAEQNYTITELETLAVVWAMSHSVTIVTDHAAVKAVLQTSNPSSKHARWWTKVYGMGVENVKIEYRAGRLNQCADALSRSPLPKTPAEGIGEEYRWPSSRLRHLQKRDLSVLSYRVHR